MNSNILFLSKLLETYSISKKDLEKNVILKLVGDICKAYGDNCEIEFSDILNDYYICLLIKNAIEYCCLYLNFNSVEKEKLKLLNYSLKKGIMSCEG